jgi:hypothetical protein
MLGAIQSLTIRLISSPVGGGRVVGCTEESLGARLGRKWWVAC